MYDPSFQERRLRDLSARYLATNTAQGTVVFQADSEEITIARATFFFEDKSAFPWFKETGFRDLLIYFLDIMIRYRNLHEVENANEGLVHIDGGNMSIEWLPTGQASVLRDRWWDEIDE